MHSKCKLLVAYNVHMILPSDIFNNALLQRNAKVLLSVSSVRPFGSLVLLSVVSFFEL